MCFHLGLAEKIYELVNKIYLNLMRPILASQNGLRFLDFNNNIKTAKYELEENKYDSVKYSY